MYLHSIRIKGFRKLEDVTVNLSGTTFLIGPNNAGKSSILKAIELLLSSKDKIEEDNYYKEKLTNFLNSSFISKYKDYKKYQEYEFLFRSSNKTYHGKIDLLLVGDSEAIIIDYKLKNTKDKAYIDQLNGYKEVISKKLNLPTSCYLYSIIGENFEKIWQNANFVV